MERISNGWQIGKASWRVLSKDRELVIIPVAAGIASFIVFLAIAGPAVLLMRGSEASNASEPAIWLFVAIAAVGATWVAAIGQGAVVAGAAERMDGGDPTIGSAYRTAVSRAGRLLEWAILSTIVAIVLDQIEQRLGILGRVISWMGSIAFSVMSFLALPIIVFEDVGAIEGFKRSSRMLRGTWGEQVTFNFGIGIIGFLAALPGFLFAGALGATGVLLLQAVGVIVGIAWVLTVAAVTSALSAVFKAALYRWAKGLPVDPAFDINAFPSAFRHR